LAQYRPLPRDATENGATEGCKTKFNSAINLGPSSFVVKIQLFNWSIITYHFFREKVLEDFHTPGTIVLFMYAEQEILVQFAHSEYLKQSLLKRQLVVRVLKKRTIG
jgi:hypothetical protein